MRVVPGERMTKKQLKAEIIRWFFLIAGGILGVVVSTVFSYINWDRFENEIINDSFRYQTLAFQSVMLFIMTIYNVGYCGMRLFGVEDHANEIKTQGDIKFLTYNLLLICLFAGSYLFD